MIKFYKIGKLSKQWNRILKNPLFLELVDFLFLTADRVTLRDLKKYFPQKGLEKILEESIELGVINRCNRAYCVELSRISDDSVTIIKSLQELKQKYSKVDTIIFYATLSDILERIETRPILVSEDDKSNWQLTYLYYASKQGDPKSKLSYFFCYQPFSQVFSLPSYLRHVAEEMPLTTKEKNLYDLLGDVNCDYLFHSFDKILFKFLEDRIGFFTQEDIFLKALIKLDWLHAFGARQYQLKIPLQIQVNLEKDLCLSLKQWVEEFGSKFDILSLRLALSAEINKNVPKELKVCLIHI